MTARIRSLVSGRCVAWSLAGLVWVLAGLGLGAGQARATDEIERAVIVPLPESEDRPAPVEPEAKDETQRWVPAVGVFSGVFAQKASGTLQSGDISYERTVRTIEGPPPPQVPVPQKVEVVTIEAFDEPIRPSASGDDLMVTPYVGATLELMTPGLTSVPGRPRVFLHGDAAVSFSLTRNVAKEGIPGAMVDPEQPLIDELLIDGQGSTTSAEVKPLVFSAGAGIAFTIDAWGRRMRIKPSFEYLREEIEVNGVVNRAIQTDTGTTGTPANNDPDLPVVPAKNSEFLFVELRGSKTQAFHGIGPGLEFEVDIARGGPFMLTMFFSGQAYRTLGDTKVEIVSQQTYSDPALTPDPQTLNAAWTFEKTPWIYRGSMGLRFRWLPE